MSRYTPGPWTFDVVTTAGVAIVSSRWGDAARVNTCVGNSARRDADARLIAAAPELYEALLAEHNAMRGEGCDDPSHPRHARVLAIRDALAKAGGQ